MTLPAAAAWAPAAIDRYLVHGAGTAVDRCLLPAPRLQQAADVDRRTDGRTPDRYIGSAQHTTRTV